MKQRPEVCNLSTLLDVDLEEDQQTFTHPSDNGISPRKIKATYDVSKNSTTSKVTQANTIPPLKTPLPPPMNSSWCVLQEFQSKRKRTPVPEITREELTSFEVIPIKILFKNKSKDSTF